MSKKIWKIVSILIGIIIVVSLIYNFAFGSKRSVEKCLDGNITVFDECINNMAEIKGHTICNYVEPELRTDCITHSAIGKNRPNVCKKISEPKSIYECYGKVSLANNNFISVQKIDDDNVREKWIMKLALKYNESDYCKRIMDINVHGECYFELAKKTLNADLCYGIDKDSHFKDECYYKLAIALKDESLCDHIRSFLDTKCMSESGA